ncbi:MAG TPA: hypothetical protein VJV03_18835 [Pyrinomonadaceae bacterium]|nr:hypothetical protein [Pyrinomonadaceae bacterium]
MKWNKCGRIYVPDGRKSWAVTHAFPPTPYFISPDVIRIYIGCCDKEMVGRVGFVDVSAANPAEIVQVAESPVLDIGTPGSFDENGVLPTSVLKVNGTIFMYYVGYQLGMKVRYFQFEGLATSADGGNTFQRRLKVPVIDRSDDEMLNRTSAFIRQRDDGSFEMWYVGGSDWTTVHGKSLPMYNIRYLTSLDGIEWGPKGRVCIELKDEDEHALGRPYVIEDGGIQKMFFARRTRSKDYRLGYAESEDGLNWTRKDDQVGIDVSDSGWDSEMISYPSVVKYKDKVYLFYNGNNLGATGFGFATLEHW